MHPDDPTERAELASRRAKHSVVSCHDESTGKIFINIKARNKLVKSHRVEATPWYHPSSITLDLVSAYCKLTYVI